MSWIPLSCVAFNICCTIFCVLRLYPMGVQAGIDKERNRCESLVKQSWERGGRLSPTARRIYCSIVDGRTELITEDEFFSRVVDALEGTITAQQAVIIEYRQLPGEEDGDR